MGAPTPAPATVQTPPPQPEARRGFRQLRTGSLYGLFGQILIWGSAISLWVVGSLYSSIPVSTSIVYGATVISIPAAAIFGLNYALVAGAVVALLSLLLSARGFQHVGKAVPRIDVDSVFVLTVLGSIGLGLFALGWTAWLGSFVAPGTSGSTDPSAYTSVLAPNLSVLVGLLVVVGGLLAFFGMLGNAVGSSKIGTTYEESTVEFGGVLSVLPVFSIIGYALSLVGLRRGERKLDDGWSPSLPPPPPPPMPPVVFYPPGYPGGPPVAAYNPQGSWDSLAAVLVVVLVLIWVLILPFSFFFFTFGGLTKGPASGPGGNNSNSPATSAGTSVGIALPLAGLAATAIILPLVIVRNRRRRQKAVNSPPPPPPPPPSSPPPPVRDEDPLDHLV